MAEYKGLVSILKHFRELLVPAGTVILYAGTVLPSRYLLCDGTRVLKADYPGLWNAIKHTWAMPTDTDAMKVDYFRLPDLRECVAVGVGYNNTHVFKTPEVDPNTGTGGTQEHDQYALGQFKDDQFQGHEHTYKATNYTRRTNDNVGAAAYVGHEDAWSEDIVTKSGYGNARYGTTTHGKQVGLYYIIKY